MFRALTAISLLAAASLGCGAPLPDAEPIVPDEEGRGDQQAKCDPGVYPCGPYGYLPGAVIRNLELPGLRDSNVNGSLEDEHLSSIKLSDYFADKSVKAIVITSSAEWCEPCKMEQAGLKEIYGQYRGTSQQVAIFEALIQDNQGAPATDEVARRWAKTYGLDFDLVIDPTGLLKPYYDIDAFPMNMIVRTSDMKIVWQENGLSPGELRKQVEKVLAQ